MTSRATTGWIPVVTAVALRAYFLTRVHEPPDLWMPDGSSYLTVTRALLDGRIAPEAWIFPPGYPLCGAALAFVGSAGAGLLASSFLSGVLLVAAALLAGRWTGRPRAGFVAALLLAGHPDLVLAGAVPLSEATFLAALVAAAFLVESAVRSGGVARAAVAGLVAGLCVLIRPEGVLAVAALSAAALARRWSVAVTFATVAAAVVLPYVALLHSASGVWALSLKPYVFVPLGEAFEQTRTYVEGRMRWEQLWETFLDENGAPDPRKLVATTSLRGRWSVTELAGAWLRNLGFAAAQLSPAAWIFGAAGLAGLAGGSPRPGPDRSRVVAVAIASPFLAAPFVQAPVGRFAVSTIPALAWGCGLLAERIAGAARDRWPDRTRRAEPRAAGALFTACALWPLLALAPVVRDYHWMGRQYEVQVSLGLGRTGEALRTAREGIRIDPEDPRFHNVLGFLLERKGDPEAAETAYRKAVRLGGDRTGLDQLTGDTSQSAGSE